MLRLHVLTALALVTGCQFVGDTGPSPPSAERCAKAAFAALDKDGDGFLGRKELQACPALLNALEKYDLDRDGKVSFEELVQRFRRFCRSQPPTKSVTFQVLLEEKPLVGADVRLEPEPFVQPPCKPAVGLTDTMGLTAPRTPELGLAGVYCGLYRIVISLKDPDGREQLPSRYNVETTLGQEIAPDLPSAIIILRLTHR